MNEYFFLTKKGLNQLRDSKFNSRGYIFFYKEEGIGNFSVSYISIEAKSLNDNYRYLDDLLQLATMRDELLITVPFHYQPANYKFLDEECNKEFLLSKVEDALTFKRKSMVRFNHFLFITNIDHLFFSIYDILDDPGLGDKVLLQGCELTLIDSKKIGRTILSSLSEKCNYLYKRYVQILDDEVNKQSASLY